MIDRGELSVRHDLLDRVPVLRLRGDIDLATRDTVSAALSVRLRGKPSVLVVDLTGVGFVGSCGLVVLDEARRTADENGTRLLFAGCNRAVLRALEVSGLLTALSPYATLVSALAHLVEIPEQRGR